MESPPRNNSAKTKAHPPVHPSSKGEVDFILSQDDQPAIMIEAKWSNDQPSAHLKHYAERLNLTRGIQLVKELKREKTFPSGLEIRRADQ